VRARLIAAGATAAWCAPALSSVCPPVAAAFGLRRRVAAPGGVALTFDDGPHPHGTPAVLEALARGGATATFFMVGEQVRRHPALAAEVAAAGHGIALHGERHRNLLRLTPATLADDLRRGAEAIATATGVAPALYRPPYGILSGAAPGVIAREGFDLLLWSRWGHDWRRSATRDSVCAEVTESLVAGDVLLLHDADHYSARDSWRATAAAVPCVLQAIAGRGLTAVSASPG
jgi:peptidoglycan/xylan/chitin deacetylase (PgdA/CDA1 family)